MMLDDLQAEYTRLEAELARLQRERARLDALALPNRDEERTYAAEVRLCHGEVVAYLARLECLQAAEPSES